MANYPQNSVSQFRFLGPAQQGQQFNQLPPDTQQFRPLGQGMPPGHSQPPQFSQPHQQMSTWHGQPVHARPSFPPPPPPVPFMQPNMSSTSSSFTFCTSFGQPQNAMNVPSQLQNGLQRPTSIPYTNQEVRSAPNVNQAASSDWQEYTANDGRRYFYNKRTKMSSWEKPLELMTPLEKADSSTVWKEFTTAEGKKYYYNKETKQSKWTIPDDLKLARGQAEKEASRSSQSLPSVSSVNDGLTIAEVASSPVAVKLQSPVSPTVNNVPSVLTNTNSSPKKNLEISHSNAVLEEKAMDVETPLLYANKQEAKAAFRSLLESSNLEADWTWEQAMRVIINDKRYGALKTLGERKQAFNEYLIEKKKLEAEEKRLRIKKAKDDFMKMLEESKELTSSMRWSKAILLFEDDARYNAIERSSDREDLFQDYLVDLKKKEKAKAQEEKRQNRLEYRKFLESCVFIKVDSQWRKVKDRLEGDERCSRLEKIDRLEIFQEYIHDLEKEDDEQRKLKKEEIKRIERKNRDEFSSMMEEHVTSGILNAKTLWADYLQKVKESTTYRAVVSNTSGATPKDLFEDVVEELEKKYHEDKTRVKDAMKIKKVNVGPEWTFGDFKDAIKDDIITPPLSDINLQLVFEDLLKRAKEKEKKEHKRKRRLAKDFTELLDDIKEINVTSTWEESKKLFEESTEYRSIGDESFCRVTFEEYVARLHEKEKREKDKDRERRHGQSSIDHRDDERRDSYKSHRHDSDHKKSRKHSYSRELESESKHKVQRIEDCGKNDVHEEEELEDGEIC